jgi:hypothetical protein
VVLENPDPVTGKYAGPWHGYDGRFEALEWTETKSEEGISIESSIDDLFQANETFKK